MGIQPGDLDTSALDLNLGQEINANNINALTAPVSNQNGIQSGVNVFSQVTKGILDLFDGGLAVYQKVNAVTGGAAARTAEAQKSIPQAVVSPVAFGLNQTQLLWVAGGLGVILVLSMTHRRA